MRMCGKCGTNKPDDAFYRSPQGRPRPPCKDCRRAYRPTQVVVSEKRCSTCAAVKPAAEFRHDARKIAGLKSSCRVCERAWRPTLIVVPKEKHCPTCDTLKPAGDFYRDDHRSDGLYARCKPCHNERAYPGQKAYKAKNSERVRKWNRQWCAEHRSSDEFKEASIAKLKKYNATHPEAKAVREQRRRANKACATINDFTAEQWEALKIAYRHCCAYCGKRTKLTMNHVIPLSKGGDHTVHNVVPACRPCNTRKSAGEAPDHQATLLL